MLDQNRLTHTYMYIHTHQQRVEPGGGVLRLLGAVPLQGAHQHRPGNQLAVIDRPVFGGHYCLYMHIRARCIIYIPLPSNPTTIPPHLGAEWHRVRRKRGRVLPDGEVVAQVLQGCVRLLYVMRVCGYIGGAVGVHVHHPLLTHAPTYTRHHHSQDVRPLEGRRHRRQRRLRRQLGRGQVK